MTESWLLEIRGRALPSVVVNPTSLRTLDEHGP